MSLRSDLDRMDRSLKPAVPLILGRTATALLFALASPRIGFPYVLSSVTLIAGTIVASHTGFQVYISDNADVADVANIPGAPVWTWRGDQIGGRGPFPHFDWSKPLAFSPMKRVAQAGTYIKVLIDDATTGAAYFVICNLQPL